MAGGPLPPTTLEFGAPMLTALYTAAGDDLDRCQASVQLSWSALAPDSNGFAAMRDNGELAAEADLDELALTMMSALQGGLLMAQTTRSARPLELALNMALGHIAGYRRSPIQEPPR